MVSWRGERYYDDGLVQQIDGVGECDGVMAWRTLLR